MLFIFKNLEKSIGIPKDERNYDERDHDDNPSRDISFFRKLHKSYFEV